MDRLDAIFSTLAQERRRKRADASGEKAEQLLGLLFAEQRAVLEDPAKRKALLCAGRAGKSFVCAVYILRTLLTVPRANILYIAYIRSEAKEIMWNVLKALDEEFQLGMHFGEAELVITGGKGGTARLAGCESWGDVDKFRGVPRHLVILDEAATWHAKLLEDLILQVIEPRLGDYKGTLLLAGTPGKVLAGPFYEATGPNAVASEEQEDGTWRSLSRPYADRVDERWAGVAWRWSLHGWALSANTSERGKSAYEAALKLKADNAWSDDNPIWVREYLGRWMADDSQLVFRYVADENDWDPGNPKDPHRSAEGRTAENPFGLPDGHYWRFVLSCDLGSTDPFALQVGAFSDTHPDLFHVYEYEYDPKEHQGKILTIEGMANAFKAVHELVDESDIEAQVCDKQGLGKTLVESLGQQYGIWLAELEQRDKVDHVELFNSALVDHRVWILKKSRLSGEMQYLAWDATGLKTRPNQRNHNCDAALGFVRHSRHLEARPVAPGPRPGTPEFDTAREREERLAIGKKQQRAARGGNPNDDDFQI